MSLKARIEAALFLTDKPLAALAVAQLVNADVQVVRQTILELIHDYEERNSALEIADDNGYMMQVKDEYGTIANDIAPIDLPVSVVRTLSAIAIKQPVLQSELVRIRGAGAYDHVKELLEKELITKKEEGRSSLLSTTKKFQEYFRLSQDAKQLRFQLKEQIDKDKLPDGTDAVPEDFAAGEGMLVPDAVALPENFSATEDIPAAEDVTAAENATTADDNAEAEDLTPKNGHSVKNEQSSSDQDGFFEPPINALASSSI